MYIEDENWATDFLEGPINPKELKKAKDNHEFEVSWNLAYKL